MKAFEPFPWKYLEDILAQKFEAHWPTVLEMLKEEYSAQVTPCPRCNTAADDLTWIPVATCDESWEGNQGAVGYLTVCLPCRQQVDFLLEPVCTKIEAETRAAGGSTFGITWRRNAE